MSNTELASLEESLHALIRQAYDLGRRDALKKVVDVLNEERPSGEQLALMAPDGTTQAPTPLPTTQEMPEPAEAEPAPALQDAHTPWWARR